ncbi:MAG: hypothetical protein AAGF23_25530 [Acidobacteriota bacterium]
MNTNKTYRAPQLAEIGSAEILTLGSASRKRECSCGKRCSCEQEELDQL